MCFHLMNILLEYLMLWFIEKQLGQQHFEIRNETCKIIASDNDDDDDGGGGGGDDDDDDDNNNNNNNNNNKCCCCDFKWLCVESSQWLTF